jgi:hypothetical protein
MNRTLLNNVLRFIGLLGLQIFLFDRINFLGYINPMIYILFIILFQDTGGANAAASLTLAFTRPLWLRLVYGESYKMKNLKVIRTPMDRLVLLMVLCLTVHHLVFFSLVIFNTSQILYTLKLTLSVGLASLLLNSLLLLLFKPRFKA